jgi:5-methylcytosine-specific restriction endonuclease McrA
LTGRSLDRDSQIDHILPRAKNGTDAIENLQWVCSEVNLAKRDMNTEDFVGLCEDVLKWIGDRIQTVEELS